MEKTFLELAKAIEQCMDKCPWNKEQTLDSMKEEPIKEAMEVKEAIEKKDYENLKEELGDLIYDTLNLATIAERKGLLTRKEVLQTIIDKLKRRKPWVFGNETVRDSAEAVRRWHEIKKQEKSLSSEKKALGKKKD
ncbi:MAG: MazG nucleotide pyrophosphohydrolase domain-containing protein [Candidatus Nanoarchaeia archaeon]|nr:MazG nucleotide pyrophosphohydrolase domain-containing protein [Candidatus Nanoarchaeia archaeon]MDD5239328.1 MazG nucleotide pyrophosphohydrolase domain-containing protein [Candidatus Nanoarchaeia archaeon]